MTRQLRFRFRVHIAFDVFAFGIFAYYDLAR